MFFEVQETKHVQTKHPLCDVSNHVFSSSVAYHNLHDIDHSAGVVEVELRDGTIRSGFPQQDGNP
jgi:hypothetical protein